MLIWSVSHSHTRGKNGTMLRLTEVQYAWQGCSQHQMALNAGTSERTFAHPSAKGYRSLRVVRWVGLDRGACLQQRRAGQEAEGQGGWPQGRCFVC